MGCHKKSSQEQLSMQGLQLTCGICGEVFSKLIKGLCNKCYNKDYRKKLKGGEDKMNKEHETEKKLNLFGALLPKTKEELEREERSKLQEEMVTTSEAVMGSLEKQRPDILLGDFWDGLDEGSKLTAFMDWFNRSGILCEMISETGALSLEGLMKLQRDTLKIEKKKILPPSTIRARINEASEMVADATVKNLKKESNPSLEK